MPDNNAHTVTLLACGDIGRFDQKVEASDDDRLDKLVLPWLQQADLRFGQCENTYSAQVSPATHGAHSNAHPRHAAIWNSAGIDVISMASNHAMKQGPKAMLETIELFRGMGKHVVGAGRDIDEARTPAVVEQKGIRIAFLAYCSVLQEGHEAGPNKPGCVPMRAHTYYMRRGYPLEESQPGTPPKIHTVAHEKDLQALQNDITSAKQQADVVVVSIHWGIHHIPKAIATYQPQVAHAAIDAGADLILGHHPHCLKAIEVYKGKACIYSLGNFMTISNAKHLIPSYWNHWDLWWYRVDSEYAAPKGIYYFPPHCRKTMLVKAIFSKKGVEKVSFLPAFINPRAQPAVVPPHDPKFQEILDYVEWLSDQHEHKFKVQGNEIVIS